MIIPLCKRGLIPVRFVLAVMMFTACFVSYMIRVNMSINIIAMVEPSAGAHKTAHVAECAPNATRNETESVDKYTAAPDYGVRYEWDSKVQGLILGAYFWGYICTCIPGGLVSERFGATKTVTISTLGSAALTLLTPLAASWHYLVVVGLRFLMGFFGGVMFPALHCLVSRWAPPEEKGKFVGALLGGALGTVATWPMLGTIITDLGWTWAFFIPGGIALIWCVLWMLLITDTPETHPRITEEEKTHILKSLGNSVEKKKAIPPYLKVFTSLPFLALALLHFGNLWGLYLLLTAGPMFMSQVLGFNLKSSGVLAALPYLARLICGFIFGYIGDKIRANNWLGVTATRKWFIIFSHFLPGILLYVLIVIGCNAPVAVTLITLSLGLNGAATLTNLQNAQDLAPNFAGSLYGIANCIGSTTGFITPFITGQLTAEKNGLREWQIIFSIGATVYIASGIIFCLFGTGEQQAWNKISEPEGVDNPAFDPPNKTAPDQKDATVEITKI